jgi:hypothetical protein
MYFFGGCAGGRNKLEFWNFCSFVYSTFKTWQMECQYLTKWCFVLTKELQKHWSFMTPNRSQKKYGNGMLFDEKRGILLLFRELKTTSGSYYRSKLHHGSSEMQVLQLAIWREKWIIEYNFFYCLWLYWGYNSKLHHGSVMQVLQLAQL